MSAFRLPPPRAALRHPAVRAALVLLVAGPAGVAWWGQAADAPVRLRALGFLLAAVVPLAWDDRAHLATAATPVGLPAVRRGRLLAVLLLACVDFAAAVPAAGSGVPVGAVALQSGAVAALLLVAVAWVGRDGDPVLAVPFPALLIALWVLNRLPREVGLLHADPGAPGWADERTRWWLLLVLCVVLVLRLQRDPAAAR